jgi:hypothetical protein
MITHKSAFCLLALALAALCPGLGICLATSSAQAQSNPVPYWTAAWPSGFGSGFAMSQGSNTYMSLSGLSLSSANLAALDGSGGGGSFSSRFDLPNGWFVGSERSGMAFNGFGGGWGGLPSVSYEGTQVGYNFGNADIPTSIYAGFGTLKYNSAFTTPLPGFDATSANSAQGYSAHMGVEFRPTSNLSLSVGASFAQQPQYDSGINSLVAPVASPFAFGARR